VALQTARHEEQQRTFVLAINLERAAWARLRHAGPDAAIALLAAQEPLINKDIEKRRLLYVYKTLIDTPEARAKGIGDVDDGRMAKAIDIIAQSYDLTNKPKPADVTPFDAVLAGHVHDFVTMNLSGYPPLIVNGESGDELDEANATQEYVAANKYTLAKPDPFASKQFGFAVYARTFAGWSISLRDANGIERRRCALSHRQVSC